MPMNQRLMRPRQTIHPEAADWANRVRANGGSVSGTTLNAVSRFCASIAAAGIRDRFFRLNLFCGTGLTACLVPLYRGPSLGGTQFGNSTDTNNNFVAGDYVETGASGGLQGNGSTKSLNTGFAANLLQASNTHLAAGLRTTETAIASASPNLIGVWNGVNNAYGINTLTASGPPCCAFTRFATTTDRFGEATNTPIAVGDLVAAWPRFYRNGTQSGTTATTSQNYPSAHNIFVFCTNVGGGSQASFTTSRLAYYSIGLTMTASQVAAYSAALAAFRSSLGRT